MAKPVFCLLATKDTSASVLYGLYDVLSNVGPDYEDMLGGNIGEARIDVKIVSNGSEPFRCLGEIPVEPHADIEQVERADVVVICDMYLSTTASPVGRYPREVAWLQRMYARDALLCSVCSGATVLAETGLLDGLEVSSHWGYRHLFREHYPHVHWAEARSLNLSAESRRLITTAGVTTWQDLSIYLIERYCGLHHAVQSSRVFLLTKHSDGQLPFAAMSRNSQHSDALIGKCQAWVDENYHRSNPVAGMAQYAELTARTLARRFRAATGYHPIEYVQGTRIEAAKQILESETTNIEEISSAVGYEDPTSFRRLFKRKVGITPAAYRKKFRSIAKPPG
jgi:transcriptional regulator GlxA family with amidase domain